MTKLKRYKKYSRKEIHDIFSPDTTFTKGAGYWGISGIIALPNTINDFAFLVTFGSKQGTHEFDEGINEEGVLTWQSQPSQSLSTSQIIKLINHDEQISTIYLFLRTSGKDDYTYLGDLAYLDHDNEREKPVYFKWQILDFDIQKAMKSVNGLTIHPSENDSDREEVSDQNILIQTDIPNGIRGRNGLETVTFRSSNINFEDRERGNDALGKAGEDRIVELEKKRLIENGREDLAEKVVTTRETIGNNAPYDIISYDVDGKERFIEVKTTKGDIDTLFYLSAKEILYSIKYSEKYKLYRLYDFDSNTGNAKYFILEGDLTELLDLEPIQFKARLSAPDNRERMQSYWNKFREQISAR